MVMISTPMPIPARKRHSNSPPDVVWQAMITEAAL